MTNFLRHSRPFLAHQGPLSMGFSRQEFWSGLPFPSPRDLPYPGIEPGSLRPPALTDIFTTSTNKPMHFLKTLCSRVYVRETSKSKLRKKKKRKKSKRERRRRVSGRGEGKKKDLKRAFTSSNYLLHPWCLDSKESTCDAVDPGLIPG